MHYLVQGDTGAELTSTVTRNDTGDTVDCSNSVVELNVRLKGQAIVLATSTGTGASMGDGEVNFDLATICALDSGYYEGEIEVTNNSSGLIESVYELEYFQIRAEF